MKRALMIAAPQSGAGKTVVTLGLLRALADAGVDIRAAKSGPDYIDPRFHEAACRAPSVNLDAWAMTPETIRALADGQGGEMLLVEAAMGLLDGAGVQGAGSAADLAATLGASVVMVIDAARAGQSAALPLAGARAVRRDLKIAGCILNRVGSARHEAMARAAITRAGFECFGALPSAEALATPSRHLGLVPAEERADLEAFTAGAAALIAERVDLNALSAAAAPVRLGGRAAALRPLGQRIAVAQDEAFGFAYPHVLTGWRAAGAEIAFFSPLADEAPDPAADAVYLPGGYPELHAGRIAAAATFLNGLRAVQGAVYGECGGYMTMGRALIDAEGRAHEMAGLLPLVTSFQTRKRSLGYRRLIPLGGPVTGPHRGHEFHYATVAEAGDAPALFAATDADGAPGPNMGMRVGAHAGSFAHLIAPE